MNKQIHSIPMVNTETIGEKMTKYFNLGFEYSFYKKYGAYVPFPDNQNQDYVKSFNDGVKEGQNT